jgi:hypothetical protein
MNQKQHASLLNAQKQPLFWVLVVAATALLLSSFVIKQNA